MPTDLELRNGEPPRIWDNTMRSILNACPRKLYYFLRGFDYAKGTTPLYFIFGRAYHSGLLSWHTKCTCGGACDELGGCSFDLENPCACHRQGTPEHGERQDVAVREALRIWDDEGAMEDKKRPTETRMNLVRKLIGYFEEYPVESWKYVVGGGEAGWIWPFNSTYELGGSLDGYIDWPGRGFAIHENKTTGEYLTPKYEEQYFHSSQLRQYFWYLSKLKGGISNGVYGALVDMVTKNIKGPRSNWNYPEYDRLLIRMSQWHLDEFEEDVHLDLQKFERYWNDWKWPKLGQTQLGECTGGPGKSACLFNPICKTPLRPEEAHPKLFVGMAERTESWEPWKRKEEV